MPDRNDEATRLQQIVGDHVDGVLSCDQARAAVVEVVFDRLDIDRISLWRFVLPASGGPRELELACFCAAHRGGPLGTCDDRLVLDEYRDYWNALVERGFFASADALGDAALQPMREAYLQKHDIRSILDAAFSLNGRAHGLICCETIGRRMAWRPADIQRLRSITTRLAVLLAAADVPLLWDAPSLPLSEIASLG